ncbi:MAG: ATP-binding protein, partial [Roseiflexaceae bacterium]
RFMRVDNSNTKSIGGTGLGLSIVKGLVELQGGRVWATSVLDKGSTFSFTLPVAGEIIRRQ